MLAKISKIHIRRDQRIICISDIHGEFDLLRRLLAKTNFCDDDLLILLGDIYTKGSQPHDTLKYCMQLSRQSNVHILRGNSDWGNDEFLSESEVKWLMDLPHIIESDEYIFVHSGLTSNDLKAQEAADCMKYDNFMELAPHFDKWVITGHWPVAAYCHEIPCHNPIINEEKRIIAIDGGNVMAPDGQLNAFIIQNGCFSHMSVDNLPVYTVKKTQRKSGGSINITWPDGIVEIEKEDGEFCRIKHLRTGKTVTVPKSQIKKDHAGHTRVWDLATDYHLPCSAGETVSLVEVFADRVYAKKNGVSGWIEIGTGMHTDLLGLQEDICKI